MRRKQIVTLTLSVAKGKRPMPGFRPLALLGVTVILGALPLSAQSVLAGRVREDSTGRPLAGVEVVIVGSERRTLTDASGRYVLNMLPDGRRLSRSFRIVSQDRAAQANQVELIYHVTQPSGRTERLVHGFTMRYLFRYEAEHLLVRAGFEIVALYGGYDRSPFGATYPGELIFVARKG